MIAIFIYFLYTVPLYFNHCYTCSIYGSFRPEIKYLYLYLYLYKLAFYRYRYNITMFDDFELCIARISQCELSDHQLAIVNNLSLSISVREGDHLLLILFYNNIYLESNIHKMFSRLLYNTHIKCSI